MMPFDLGYPHSTYISKRPGYTGTSLQEVALRFPSEDACFEHICDVRGLNRGLCDKCDKVGRWYRRSDAKYIQHACGAVVSPMAQTVFHASKIPLKLWFYGFLHFANSSNGVNTKFLEHQLSISYAAAFRMGLRIRSHMWALQSSVNLSRSRAIHVRLMILNHVRGENRERNSVNLFIVTDGMTINTYLIDDPRRHNLSAIIRSYSPKTQIITTDYRTFRVLSNYELRKPIAEFYPDFFLKNPAEHDAISGFMSYFELPFLLKHKHASRANIQFYLKEFEFRYNRRYRSKDIFWDMVNAFPRISRPLMGATI